MDDNDDDDYLSDAILARLEDPRPLTYTERQTKRQVQHVARQAQEMRDAEARRRVKARLAHEGEADARRQGLLTNGLAAPPVGSRGGRRGPAPAPLDHPARGAGRGRGHVGSPAHDASAGVRWKWRLAAIARPAMARFTTGPRADG